MALPPIFRLIFAGIGVIAGGSAVFCKIKLDELTNTTWGYYFPGMFDPWIQGIGISTVICLLALFVAICPWCYRKDTSTAYPALAAEAEARACGLAGDLGLPETAVTQRRGKEGIEIIVRLPPEGGR